MIDCKFENGNKANLRHAVTDALAIRDGKIALVKRANRLTNPGKWALSGGFAERDTSLEQNALKELREETGLDGDIVRLFKVVDDHKSPNKDDRQCVKFVYEIKASGRISSSDEGEARWFDFKELPKEGEFAFDHFEIVKEFIKEKGQIKK